MPKLRIITGNAIEEIGRLKEGSVDAIVTDPPWPNCKVDTGWRGDEWWGDVVVCMERLVGDKGKILIHLNSQTDPRPMLEPFTLPFIHICWLRFAVPRYRGNILNCGDVVYQFGHGYLPEGRRVMTEEIVGPTIKGDKIAWHPCARNLTHLVGLVASQVGPGRTIMDPFMGSGTTGIAAIKNQCDFIGVDCNPEYTARAKSRIMNEAGLFVE